MNPAQRLLVRATAVVGRLRRGITLGVRVAAFDAETRVFLVRHRHLPGWYLPGGAVEVGESAKAAAVRELKEEAGLVAKEMDLFGLYFNALPSRRDHVALYVCREWVGLPRQPYPNVEIVEGAFFSRRELPDALTQATARRLAEILDGVLPTDDW